SHDLIVIEGAGSPAEINLKDRDLVNMFVAKIADAPVLLVGDIDRGGVFAAFVGTMELLEPDERSRVAGFVINKFRGDVRLLDSGLRFLEERTGVPVLGVLPYVPKLRVADEDSLALDDRRGRARAREGELEIAVVRLPRISNYDDFQPLEHEPGVVVRFVERAADLERADLVVLPGTKTTCADLAWLRESGLARGYRRPRRVGWARPRRLRRLSDARPHDRGSRRRRIGPEIGGGPRASSSASPVRARQAHGAGSRASGGGALALERRRRAWLRDSHGPRREARWRARRVRSPRAKRCAGRRRRWCGVARRVRRGHDDPRSVRESARPPSAPRGAPARARVGRVGDHEPRGQRDGRIRSAGRGGSREHPDGPPEQDGRAVSGEVPGRFDDASRSALYRIMELRRDIRKFCPGEIDPAALDRILRAADVAPSVGFSQPWAFMVVRDAGVRARVRESFLRCREAESARFPADRREKYLAYKLEGIAESTLNLCVAADLRPRDEAILGTTVQPDAVRASVCCAVQNLWLAARAEGLGVGWVSIVEPAVLRRELGLPAGVEPIAYLCIGHAEAFHERPMLEETKWRARRELSELVHMDRFRGGASG